MNPRGQPTVAEGVAMDTRSLGRRDFLATLGAVGLPLVVSGLRPAGAAAAVIEGGRKATYNPMAHFEVTARDVELRRASSGRQLLARIYQPQGPGPFPTILDLHGGAWNRKNRMAEEPMDRALAASGLLVVAIDMTLAPEAPYPA